MDDEGWCELSGRYAWALSFLMDLLLEMFVFSRFEAQVDFFFVRSVKMNTLHLWILALFFCQDKMFLDVWEIMTEFYLVQ